MDIESKRELNNILLRKYNGSSNKMYWFKQIMSCNFDFVSFVIKTYFPEYIGDENIYGIGILGLMTSLEAYEMYQESSFEEFMMASIKNEISNFLNEKNKAGKTK